MGQVGNGQLSLAKLVKLVEARQGEVRGMKKVRDSFLKRAKLLQSRIDTLEGGASGTRARNAITLNEAIAKALSKGGALSVGKIVDGVKAQGYRSNSANFRGIVNQTLIKDKRFVATSRGVYRAK